jgi:hypothetical protein
MLILGIVVVVALFGILFMWPVETEETSPSFEASEYEGDDAMAAVAATEEKTFELSIITDKEVYDEGDSINVTLVIDSPIDVDRAEFTLNAVKDKRGYWEIRESEEMGLSEGKNSIEFNERLPSCSSCSGVAEGEHEIEAILTFKNETPIANTTTTIELIG